MVRAKSSVSPDAGSIPPELTGGSELLSHATVALERAKGGRGEKRLVTKPEKYSHILKLYLSP
jgi:hypothetical protein